MTTLASPPAVPERVSPPMPGSPRVVVTAAAAAAAVAFPLGGLTGPWVAAALLAAALGAAAACASPARMGRLSVAAVLPLGLVAWVVAAAAWGQLAALTGLAAWGTRSHGLLIWVAANAVVVVAAVLRGGRVHLVRPDTAAVTVGAAVIGVGLLAALLQPFEVLARSVSQGTDLNRHMLIMQGVLNSGEVSYVAGQQEYPRALHGWLAVLWSASGGSTYESAWQAVAAVLWVLTAVIGLAVAVTAVRLSRRFVVPGWVSGGAVPLVVFVAFVQGAWVIAIFAGGFLTTTFAGVVLAGLVVLPFEAPWLGTPRSLFATCAAAAALAQTWPLLAPVPAVLLLVTGAVGLRRRTLSAWLAVAVVAAGVLVSAPLGVTLVSGRSGSGEVGSDLAMFGYSGLWTPRLWWVAVAVAAVAFAAWQLRIAPKDWPTAYLVMAVTSVVVVTGLFAWSGSGWETPSYYPVKALWTVSPLVLGPGIAAVLCLLTALIRGALRQPAGMRRIAVLGAVAAVCTILAAGVAGRLVGTPSELGAMVFRGGSGLPLNLPMVAALEDLPQAPPGTPAIVFGLTPYGSADGMKGAGMLDVFGAEALGWFGYVPLAGDAAVVQLTQRDTKALCDYLRAHPEAIRVTGPNPVTGAQWLIDAGCPRSVVKPELWTAVPIPDSWFDRLQIHERPYEFPSYREYQQYLRSQLAG